MLKQTNIDASGLACPQPVILTKKALQENDRVTVIVDNKTAVENIKRLAGSMKCSIETVEKGSGKYELMLAKSAAFDPKAGEENISCDAGVNQSGPSIVVFNSDIMGKGNDELGEILMKAFIHTVTELDNKPDVIIFYNTGVKLIAEGSGMADDFKMLESRGTKLLVCGTCVNYFNLTGKVTAGTVSNMYDIAGTLSRAGRIIQP